MMLSVFYRSKKFLYSFFLLISLSAPSFAQKTLTDVMDSTAVNHLLIISKKYGSLSFSGYLQPQFQVAQSNGADAEYQGGNFADNTSNRFRLRRGRLRADYMLNTDAGDPSTYFVLQFDGTEKGVAIRDFWGRYYENELKLMYLTIGLAGRPFGYEAQLTSSIREAPERGRMSQILMKSERDLGATLSFNPRWKDATLKNLKLDIGVYNGQGLAGEAEFDNSKDVIVRLSHKEYAFKNLMFSVAGGLSTLQGGLNSQLPVLYKMGRNNNQWAMTKDSSANNINAVAPRRYYGADIQLETTTKKWKSELRAEIISGLQTGTSTNSTTPGSYPVDDKNLALPYYTRNFNGAYVTFIQNLKTPKNQLILKYDFYDPNSKVSGHEISKLNGMSAADVRFDTFGVGLLRHFNEHFKVVLYYDMIKNESTQISGYDTDRKDNIFTLRTQFYF